MAVRICTTCGKKGGGQLAVAVRMKLRSLSHTCARSKVL
jgi:hypothetical protein